ALQPLDRALGLRVGRLAEAPADPQLAAERGERLARATAVTVDPGLAVPEQDLRQPTQTLQAARDTGEQVLGPGREDQHPGAGSAIAQARDHDIAAARLAVTDRHRRPGLPDVELTDLPGPPDRPLKRPRRRREQRPHLAQVGIHARLARPAAQ